MTSMPVPQRIRLALLIPAIALAADYALYRILFAAPAHDQAWLLYAASLVLHGTKLYGPHLTESNPPLIVWLNLLPAWLSDRTGRDALLCLRVCVTVLALACTAVSVQILRAAGLVRDALSTALAATGLLAICVALGDTDFGQKEQLLVLLLLPYLFSRLSPQALPRWQRLALSLAAGVGLCLKPHQWLLVIAFELCLLFARRRARFTSELLVLLLVPCAYLLAIVLFGRAYLTDTVPLLRQTYWAYGQSPFAPLLVRNPWFDSGLALTFALWLLLRRRLLLPLAPIALLSAAAGAAVAYALQGNAWNYHFYPQKALLLCAMGCLLVDAFALVSAPSSVSERAALFGALILAAALVPAVMRSGRRQEAAKNSEKQSKLACFATAESASPITIYSTNLVEFGDRMGRVWGSRYAHLWLLPAAVRREDARLAELQRTTSAEDLAYWKPGVVGVRHCTVANPCQGLEGFEFDMQAWLQQSAAFRKQWQHYRLRRVCGDVDVYERLD